MANGWCVEAGDAAEDDDEACADGDSARLCGVFGVWLCIHTVSNKLAGAIRIIELDAEGNTADPADHLMWTPLTGWSDKDL